MRWRSSTCAHTPLHTPLAWPLLPPHPQLQVYALEIQMYTEQRNNKKLKQLYQKALAVKSAIPHPRILGIIRECGGKMYMRDQNWQEAATDFFEVRAPGVVLSTSLPRPSLLSFHPT